MTLKTIAETVGVSRTTVSNAYNRPDQLAPELRDRILGDRAPARLRRPRPRRAPAALRPPRRGRAAARRRPRVRVRRPGRRRSCSRASPAPPRPRGWPCSCSRRGDGVQDAVVDAFCLLSLAADHPNVMAAQRARRAARGRRRAAPGRARLRRRRGPPRRAAGRRAPARARPPALRDRAEPVGSAGAQRLAGYRDALEAAGVDWGDVPRVVRVRAGPERPTAVLAATDRLALGVIEAAREAGLRVPEDLSVVGFDDIPAPRASRPGLTTVRQPLFEKGETAGRLLTEGAAEPRGDPARRARGPRLDRRRPRGRSPGPCRCTRSGRSGSRRRPCRSSPGR